MDFLQVRKAADVLRTGPALPSLGAQKSANDVKSMRIEAYPAQRW
jgi:hypothetical protein